MGQSSTSGLVEVMKIALSVKVVFEAGASMEVRVPEAEPNWRLVCSVHLAATP